MKIIAVFLLGLSVATAPAFEVWTLRGQASVGVLDQYVGPSGYVYAKGPLITTKLFVESYFGGYINILGYTATKSADKSANEADYIVGWAGPLKGLDWDLGVGYYDFAKIWSRRDNTWAWYAEVSKTYPFLAIPVFTVTPLLGYEESLPSSEASYGNDHIIYGQVTWRVDPTENLGLYMSPEYGHDSGMYGYSSTSYEKLGVGMDVGVDGVVYNTEVTYLYSDDHIDETDDVEMQFAVKATIAF